jgi:hypothetical protein
MIIATLAVAAALAQQPAAETQKPELAIISARLGSCAADFTVKDADGKPVYAATVHVRVRYGFMSLKRMDLEVGTNSDGKARVEGLPEKGKLLAYDITKADKKAAVEQDLEISCHKVFDVSLK